MKLSFKSRDLFCCGGLLWVSVCGIVSLCLVSFQSCQVSFQFAWTGFFAAMLGALEIDGFVHLWVGISTGIMHLVSQDGLSKWKIVELTVESPGATRPHVPWWKTSWRCPEMLEPVLAEVFLCWDPQKMAQLVWWTRYNCRTVYSMQIYS